MPYTAEERAERNLDANRRWREANRESERARHRANREANLESEQRRNRLRNWKTDNVNPWPYASLEELHDNRYIVAEHCEYCGPRWGDFATLELTARRNPRRMEHDHRPPFLFRAISCQRCNVRRGVWDARILAVHEELPR